jgi:hypothetical protein
MSMPRYKITRKPKSSEKRSLLPLWLVLVGLGLLGLAVFGFWQSNQTAEAGIQVNGSPKLEVDQETIDHGNVKLGETITDQVKITNIGDQTLRFIEKPYIQVKEGC